MQGTDDLKNGRVPDVTGMGLREALNLLEKQGWTVSFEGHGIVAGQRPAAGDSIREKQITLTLKEKYIHETK